MAGDEDWTQARRGLDVPPEPSDEAVVIRHEEVATVGTRWRGAGSVKAKKRVDTLKVDELIEKTRERVELERAPVEDGDAGGIETLADGSISIPVYEERLVVTKEVVLTERVVIRKQVETVTERVRDELRRERVEIETDGDVKRDG
ncbi:MAG: YsnF/AvaK domain-containing protein [Actinobacteria bacterium]|nr:YsnF/AvaK domain-containing protein [Actinomycetota bacterium]